jgi:hypothetical protein
MPCSSLTAFSPRTTHPLSGGFDVRISRSAGPHCKCQIPHTSLDKIIRRRDIDQLHRPGGLAALPPPLGMPAPRRRDLPSRRRLTRAAMAIMKGHGRCTQFASATGGGAGGYPPRSPPTDDVAQLQHENEARPPTGRRSASPRCGAAGDHAALRRVLPRGAAYQSTGFSGDCGGQIMIPSMT